MARDSYEMQEEFNDELSKSDVGLGGLRYITEAIGLPTDTESIEIATRGVPAYGLIEAISDGRLSELLEGIGEGPSVEELISSVTDLPVEEAGLAAMVMGAMSPGGRFKSMREGLEAIKERLLSKEKHPDKSEVDLLREQGATPSVLNRMRPSEAYISPKKRVEGQTSGIAKKFDAYDSGLTEKMPTRSFQRLYAMADRRGVDIDDLVQELRQNAFPTGRGGRDRGRPGDQIELDFYPEKGLPSVFKFEKDLTGTGTGGRRKFEELLQEVRDRYMDSPEALQKALEEQKRILKKARFDGDLMAAGGRPGLYANIAAKRKRIAAGSGEKMRSPGSKGAPTKENFRQAATTARKAAGGGLNYAKGYYGKSYK